MNPNSDMFSFLLLSFHFSYFKCHLFHSQLDFINVNIHFSTCPCAEYERKRLPKLHMDFIYCKRKHTLKKNAFSNLPCSRCLIYVLVHIFLSLCNHRRCDVMLRKQKIFQQTKKKKKGKLCSSYKLRGNLFCFLYKNITEMFILG